MASIKRTHIPTCAGNGTCQCPWLLDFRPQGMSGARKRVLFDTRKAAELHLATTAVKVSRREYVEPGKVPTFGTLAAQWMLEKADLHPSTLSGWRRHLVHLTPLNPMRLDQISIATIEGLRDALRAKGLGFKTVSYVMSTASGIFKTAIRRGCTTSNPAAIAKRPRKPVVEVKDAGEAETGALRADEVLNADEIRRLLEAASPGLWRALFATAAATGMRSEELLALQWGDVELDAGRLFVRRSLSWAPDADRVGTIKPRFFEPKTKAGYRALPLAPELVSMLRAWKIACPASPHGLVFCHTGGLPLARSNIQKNGVHPACRRAGLRACGLKTLRHSFASGLLAAGCPITQVQHLLGHSNPGITLRVYSHWLPSEDTGVPARFAASFLGELAPARMKA
jgi:integrase